MAGQPVSTLLALFAASLVAGFVDSIAGGGGLITVPALALAGLDPLTVVATNKLQSSFGSGSATLSYWRAGRIDLRSMGMLPLAAAGGAILGALSLRAIPRDAAMAALPFLLVAVAVYFALAPRAGEVDVHQRMSRPLFLATVIPAIGFYDGVFGPGTGSFLTIGFVALMGYGLLKATAHTKLANFASNLAGLGTLALSGHVLWGTGIVMGLGQFLGARLGVAVTLRHGARLVRPLLVAICCLLAGKLLLDPANPAGMTLRGWISPR